MNDNGTPEPVLKSPFMRAEFVQEGALQEWHIRNIKSNAVLGRVVWCAGWRQFVFQPVPQEVIFSTDCLIALATFVADATAWRKARATAGGRG